MTVSRLRPSRPSSGSYFTPFCTNTSILSVERPSTQYAISLTIPWDAEDRGTPCKPNLLPCARAQTPAPANAHSASFLDVQTLSWTFRPMPSFGCSKKVYRTDRASRFVSPPTSHVRLTPINSGHRSGMQLFALLRPISPLPIHTKLHSPYPSCTPCWTPSHLSPTHTCPSSLSPSLLSLPPTPNSSSPTSKFCSLSSPL
jgi:hypothetical protein